MEFSNLLGLFAMFFFLVGGVLGGGNSFDQNYYATWGSNHVLKQGEQVQLSMDQSSVGGVFGGGISFDQNYYVTWASNHVLKQGERVQLSMDRSSGAGFASKQSYGSGFFTMRIKLPDRNSAGVVTAYYLRSHSDRHDELDFEFLGNEEGKPVLQTNVFAKGVGNREQKFNLWFDPTADFHTYSILWNPHQIVFYVDKIPIRVFKNNQNIGVDYPSQAMQITASLWNGDSWATNGGKTKINWTYAPFKAHFLGFDISGCSNWKTQRCYSSRYWWNSQKYWRLNSIQQRQYENVRRNFMKYDYCSDRTRYPTPPKECPYNA